MPASSFGSDGQHQRKAVGEVESVGRIEVGPKKTHNSLQIPEFADHEAFDVPDDFFGSGE